MPIRVIEIRLPSDLYDWIVKTAEESSKTPHQLIEDAIWSYKYAIENPENSKKDKDWRFR